MSESTLPIQHYGRYCPVPSDLEDHESLKVGMHLPNHATVVASKPSGNRKREGGRPEAWVVLAVYEGYQPYVTWVVGDETLEAVWGHYHTSLGDALVDFAERT